MKNLSKKLTKKVKRLARRGWGVSRIFNHLKKLGCCKDQPKLGLLRFILVEFKQLKKSPSKEMIRHFFKTKVPKDEWEGNKKKDVLFDLYNPL